MPPILFVHIPKTAGTSFRIAAIDALGEDAVACDYGRNSPATTKEIATHLYGTRDLDALRDSLAGKRMIAGHFCVTKWLPLFPDAPVVSFLRDPIDRVESEYNHFVTRHGYTDSIEAWVRTPSFRNKQRLYTRPFEPWHFTWLGSTEHFDRDMPKLREALGVPIRARRENARSAHAGHVMSRELVRLIVDFNAADLRMTYLADAVRDSDEPAPPRPRAFAMATHAPDGGLRGYAMALDSVAPLSVELVRNGDVVRRVVADTMRPDLLAHHAHLTGEVGFELAAETLAPLGPMHALSLRVAGTGRPIPIRPGHDFFLV